MPDIFIELDRDFDILGEQEPPSRPSRLGNRWRPWVAAGLAMAILSTLGNAEFRPDSGVQLVTQFETDSSARLAVFGNALFVAEPDRLTSYEPSSGQRLWQARTGLFEPNLSVDGDLVVLNGMANRRDVGEHPQQASVGVELSTGEIRWRIPGFVEILEDVLVSYVYDESAPVLEQQTDLVLSVYTRDGQRKLWSTQPGKTGPAVNPERSLLSTLDRHTGELVEHNLHTGAVVNRYTFPELVGANGFFYDRGRAMFFFEDGRNLLFDGITLTSDFDERAAFAQTEPVDCGKVWCRYRVDGSGFYLVDKDTGQKVFEATSWDLIMRTEVGLVGLRFPQNDGPMRVQGVFDPQTGVELLVEGWSVFEVDYRDPLSVTSKGPVYLWSYQKQLDYFGVLKSDGVRTIGVLPHTGELRQCAVAAPHVACLVGTNLVRIWRLT